MDIFLATRKDLLMAFGLGWANDASLQDHRSDGAGNCARPLCGKDDGPFSFISKINYRFCAVREHLHSLAHRCTAHIVFLL